MPGVGFVAESQPPGEGEFPVPFAVSGTKPSLDPGTRAAGKPAPPRVKLPGGATALPPVSLESLPSLPDAGTETKDKDEASPPAPATKPAAKAKKPVNIDRSLLEKALRNRNAGAVPQAAPGS